MCEGTHQASAVGPPQLSHSNVMREKREREKFTWMLGCLANDSFTIQQAQASFGSALMPGNVDIYSHSCMDKYVKLQYMYMYIGICSLLCLFSLKGTFLTG